MKNTVRDLIAELEALPEDQKDLPVHVWSDAADRHERWDGTVFTEPGHYVLLES